MRGIEATGGSFTIMRSKAVEVICGPSDISTFIVTEVEAIDRPGLKEKIFPLKVIYDGVGTILVLKLTVNG